MSDNGQPPQFDPTSFSVDPYVKKIDKPWGYELYWVPADAPYMGKILHINKGTRLSLQLHDQKQESWLLMQGQAAVIWENEQGELVQTKLELGRGYNTQLGQRHRLVGLTDCDVVEVSTPELGTTWRLDDDYARPHETPEQRDRERHS
ncbi:MAG TPA: cupin [Verrucomicrobiae bacterium]|jgi:mannose-6-phosphate isomerase|nr:cupin [Verrucomicrobiae bacterium]